LNDCITCKRYEESLKKNKALACYEADYYTPGMVSYCRPQMMWLIEWLPVIEDGDWPPDPKETGYTEPAVQTTRSSRAHFENAAQVAAEVTARLARTGKDGETLVHLIQSGLSDYQRLPPSALNALNYISGWRRKKDSYSRWGYDQRRKSENIRIRKT